MSLSLLSTAKPLYISSCFAYLVSCVCHIKPCEGHRERDCHFAVEETGGQLTAHISLVPEPGLAPVHAGPLL